MRRLSCAAVAASLVWTLRGAAAPEVPVPPFHPPEQRAGLAAAGAWQAPPEALDYAATRTRALTAERQGDAGGALTAWERVLDRTTCTETQRGEART
ncbi:MAG: hypothetical protein LBW77_07470, partial [Verrucomicrobiota bacterium]|nr:hypothetical protein [Verrucomicrobiota bacterium]